MPRNSEKGSNGRIATTIPWKYVPMVLIAPIIINLNQQMTFEGLKSNLCIAVMMIGAINTIGTYFQGIVVAKSSPGIFL